MSITIDTNKIYNEIMKKEDNNLLVDEKEFSYIIKQRGREYYENKNVLYCYRCNDNYYSKVEGMDEDYNVKFERVFIDSDNPDYDLDNNYKYKYSCDCPCGFPCKHEYAVALAIKNNEYEEKEIKEYIPKKKISIKELLKQIPADELKDFILSNTNSSIDISNSLLESKFIKYFPKQSYEYYYNNLYNPLVIPVKGNDIYEYITLIKSYIDSNEYEESFKIIKSIIEVYRDLNQINEDYFIEKLNILEVFLRITYRKCNINLKQSIDNWIDILEQNNYYNSVYLEDFIISIKK